jgi:Fe-S cluster assembly ATP-binding protein
MKDMLEIKNLHVSTADGTKDILHGVSLVIKKGEKHAIMGPNGGGKSTLAQVLMGHPGYTITKGSIILKGTDITGMPPDQRAKLGLFLGFQYPVEVAGVNFANFLRMCMNELKAEGEKKVSPIALRNQLAEQAKKLGFSDELAKRSLNQDFSGGEKKKAEILQLAMLKPQFAILDEPDSGLDVDALRYIANALNSLEHSMGLLLITHYQRILAYVKPDFVHVVKGGKIVASGGPELAEKVEQSGYENLA